MSTINYVCSEIKVICSNKEAYEEIAQIYKRKLQDYGNSLLIENEFLVAMVDEIETNYMSDHAVDFLKNIIAYAQEIDPKTQFDGEITWQDEQYCTGEVHVEEQNGCYSVSKPVCRDREESVIHDALTETLVEELQRRGVTSLRKSDSEHAFKVKIPGGYLMVQGKGAEQEYPGVYISFSPDGEKYDVNHMVACIEFDSCTEETRAETYRENCDEPDHIISHETGHDLM